MAKLSVFFSYFFMLLVYTMLINGSDEKSFSMIGKLKSGLQLAGKLLGLDQTSGGVAVLVSEAFGKNHQQIHNNNKKGDTAESISASNNIFSAFLRLLGFESRKVGAIAVNAIIFIAQLISSSLSLQPPSQLTEARNFKSNSLFDYLLNNTKVTQVLGITKDKTLPQRITMYVKEHSLDEETDCLQLLICKSGPFIWGMQKAINERGKISGSEALFVYLPSIEEVEEHGNQCERKHPYCFKYL